MAGISVRPRSKRVAFVSFTLCRFVLVERGLLLMVVFVRCANALSAKTHFNYAIEIAAEMRLTLAGQKAVAFGDSLILFT